MLPLARALRSLGLAAADGPLPLRLLAPLSSRSAAPPEYEMPSVTWGVIQGRKERLVSRVLALDFLRSGGVSDPAGELEAVELPSSLDVLQERLDFLLRLGLSTDDLSAYPLLLACSLRKNVIPVLSYLEKLGVTRARLAAFVRAYPACLHVAVDFAPIVKSLRGLRKEALPLVIAQYPPILGLPLKAKLAAQQYFFNLKLKIDPDGFSRAVEKLPQLVSLHQNVTLKPVEFLRGRGIADEDVARMVVRCPQILLLRNELMKNSFYFFKSEMKRPIGQLLEYPEYFTYSLESRIKPRYMRVASKGIRCTLDWFLNCSDQRFEERRMRGDFIEGDAPGPSFTMGGKLQMPDSQLVSDDDNEDSDDEVLYRRTVML